MAGGSTFRRTLLPAAVGRKIEWLARHDALTDIANRFHFRERLEHQFECYDPRLGFALLWIDLDHFKLINDRTATGR